MIQPDLCTLGITISLSLRFRSLKDNMYIYTNCGDQPDSTGYAMFYRSGRVYFTVSSRSREWTVSTPITSINTLYHFDVSWSKQFGLHMYMDYELKASTTDFLYRDVPKPKDCNLYIGAPQANGTFTEMELEYWNIRLASREILIYLGFVIGLPSFSVAPTLAVGLDNDTGKAMFTCRFQQFRADVRYEVEWYLGDTKLTNQNLTRDDYETTLSEDMYGEPKYGTGLYCKVSACFSSNCQITKGDPSYSNVIYNSIRTVTEELTISEGSSAKNLTFRSMVPPRLLCKVADRSDNCNVTIWTSLRPHKEKRCPGGTQIAQAVFPTMSDNSTGHLTTCGAMATSTVTWQQDINIPILAKIDGLNDGDQKKSIQVEIRVESASSVPVRYITDRIQLTVEDRDRSAICKSINDPHMTTFDGLKYDNFYEGEFVLYRHKILPYAVHTFYRSCNGHASCNCAVAVRSGDDVIVIDVCGPTKTDRVQPLTKIMYLNGQLTPGTYVYRKNSGSTYVIYLPNGAYLTVKKRGKYLNVWMKSAPSDINSVEGLCGNFDGDTDNDLMTPNGTIIEYKKIPTTFSVTWRVSTDATLYNGYCGDTTLEFQSSITGNGGYSCDCFYNEAPQCGVGNDVVNCGIVRNRKNKRVQDITTELVLESVQPLKCISSVIQIIFQFNINYIAVVNDFPTPSGITYQMAYDKCSQHITASVSGAACQSVPSVDFSATIDSCVVDVRLTDTFEDWLDTALSDINQQCLTAMETNITLWVEGDDGLPLFPDTLELLCPNECSNHGNCSKGVCSCDPAYGGDDCSIVLADPPTLVDIFRGKICDRRTTTCERIVIFGLGFSSSANLSCSFLITDRPTVLQHATFQSYDDIACPLPANVDTFDAVISCTNDGLSFSNSLDYIVYDSLCTYCNSTGHCFNRTDVCRINSVCYEDGTVDENDQNQVCDISKSTTSWSQLQAGTVTVHYFRFLRIELSILFAGTYQFNLIGSPRLVYGSLGGFAILLNGVNQAFNLGDLTSGCIGDIEKCNLGVTWTFGLEIKSVDVSKVYVFSNGGDEGDRYGYAMWFTGNRLYCRVTTRTREWTVYTNNFKIGRHYLVQFSWSLQTGLRLYLDNTRVAKTTNYIDRGAVTVTLSTDFFFGQSLTGQTFCNMAIDRFSVATASLDIIEQLDISFTLPTFDEEPDIDVDVVNGSISLTCTFKPITMTTRPYLYKVMWYNDNTTVMSYDLDNQTFASKLSEETLGKITYGSKIMCGVMACYADDCNGTTGPERRSDSLATTIQFEKTSIKVYEGGVSECVSIRSVLPPRMFCSDKDTNCSIQISHNFSEAMSSYCPSGRRLPQAMFQVEGNNSCSVHITDKNWMTEICIKVRATLDGLKDDDQEQKVHLVPMLLDGIAVTEFTSVSISVKVIDQDRTATCTSINDPHITTFDKRKYDNFFEGEFVLFKHKSLPYEVRAFYRSCNKRASCNCAVAVRSGDDVIVIDRCGAKDRGKKAPLVPRIYINGVLTVGTYVISFNNGKMYKIVLPTGGYVTVKIAGKKKEYINIFYKAAAVDYGNAEGLCGNFDGNPSNDLKYPDGTEYFGTEKRPKDFSKSWRVTELGISSLYNGICPEDVPPAVTMETYCDCDINSMTCTNNLDLLSCNQPLSVEHLQDESKKKKRRSKYGVDMTSTYIKAAKAPTKCFSTEPEILFDFNITYVSADFTWPTPGGITEAGALASCKAYIEGTAAFQGCRDVPDIGFALSLDSCVADLQIMDDIDWAEEALSAILQLCTIQMEINVELWMVVDGIPAPNPSVIDFLCPSLCSGNGNCVEQVCVCSPGFAGEDCSIIIQDVPAVDLLPEPFCDLARFPCQQVTITGQGFIQGADLVCILQRVEKTTTTYTAIGDTITVTATYVSSEQVICDLPDAGSFNITVSNAGGGVVITTAVLFVTFNQICYDCSENGCQPKTNVCFIGDGCYGDGFFNPASPLEICNASLSSNTWSIVTRAEVLEVSFFFLSISVNILTTSTVTFTVVGNPVLVAGPTGQALQLDGVSQYIDLSGQLNTCITDLTTCGLGMTMGFNLKVITFTENMYILNFGGDKADGYGVAMYYRHSRLYLTVSTATAEWTVYTTRLQVNTFVNIEFSWSIQTGLALYFDGAVVASTTQFITRTVTVTRVTNLYIGWSSTTVYANIVIEGWVITEACKEIVSVLDDVETTTELMTSTTEQVTNSTTEMTTTTEMNATSTTEQVTTSTIATTSTTEKAPTSTSTVTTITTPVTTTTTPATTTTSCTGAEDSYPSITTKPALTHTVASNLNKVSYTCSITASTEQGAQHAIWWYVGDSLTKSTNLTSGVTTDNLETTELTSTAGLLTTGIKCAVVVWNPSRCGNGVSPPLNSDSIVFTVTVNEGDIITVREGSPSYEIRISLTQTVNYYCAVKYGQACLVQMKSQVVKGSDQRLCTDSSVIPDLVVQTSATNVSLATCGFTADSSNQNFVVRIKAVVDNLVSRPRNRTLNIVMVDSAGSQTSESVLKNVTVIIEDVDLIGMCHSQNDPHISTFDDVLYENHLQGEFVMYRNIEENVEVRALFVRCGDGTCNCGVLIRSGDDVIKIHKCLPGTLQAYPVSRRLFINSQLTSGSKIYQAQDGNQYEIYLPTGTKVTLKNDQDKYMNVYIKASILDVNKTDGLCGKYDGLQANDLVGADGQIYTVNSADEQPNDFSVTWRVDNVDSYFPLGYTSTVTLDTPVYCLCYDDGSTTCNYNQDVYNCGESSAGLDLTQTLIDEALADEQQQQTTARRRKRATPDPTFVYDPNYVAPFPLTWPTSNGITEAVAQTTCGNKIVGSETYTQCKDLLTDNAIERVNACMRDVQLTGSFTWADSGLASLQEACNNAVKSNTSLWGSATPTATPTLPSAVVNTLCPNLCSGQGTCNAGDCTCQTGFAGPDCSLTVNEVPIVVPQVTNAVCDTLTSTCGTFMVYGDKFLNSSTLTCHLTEVQVSSTGVVKTSATSTSAAQFQRLTAALCVIPQNKSYVVRISNDGSTLSSNEALFVVYKSTCFLCSVNQTSTDATCSAKSDACYIGSVCYAANDFDPTDSCKYCRPSVSTSDWTTSTTATGCSTRIDEHSKTVVIVTSVVAAFLLIIIITLGVVYVRKNYSKGKLASKERSGRPQMNGNGRRVRYKDDPQMFMYDNQSFDQQSTPAHEYGMSYDNPTGSGYYTAQHQEPMTFYQTNTNGYFDD